MLLIYKEDTINFLRGITAPVIFISPFIFGLPDGYEVYVVLGLWILLNDINHVLHLHTHCPFTKNKLLNSYLDIGMGLVTGMTAANWRIQHKYRHHHVNKKDYGNGMKWEVAKYSILGSISYSFRTIFPILLLPIIEAFKKGFLQKKTAPINYRVAFFEQLLPYITFIGLVLLNKQLAYYYVLPWYFLVNYVTRYIDYLNHFNTGNDLYTFSNNSLNDTYNKLGCNFGYHTAHHIRPSAHWTKLPQIHKNIENNISKKFIKNYSWSGFAMPLHFWLSLRSKM